MAEENKEAPAAAPAAQAPQMNMLAQYIRDLSFENPGAPQSTLDAAAATPQFNVSINVQVKNQSEEIYAVELTLNAEAKRETNILFKVELVYGGVFRLKNLQEQHLPPLLMIECPRLLFPFARQVLANITQAGGFPPLLMEPVNFESIYRQNLAKFAEESAAAKPKN